MLLSVYPLTRQIPLDFVYNVSLFGSSGFSVDEFTDILPASGLLKAINNTGISVTSKYSVNHVLNFNPAKEKQNKSGHAKKFLLKYIHAYYRIL